MIEGIIIGMNAGLMPGAHMMYMLATTLQYGIRKGLLVAYAPIFAELPVIVLLLYSMQKGLFSESVLMLIGLLGGCLLIYLGISSLLRTRNHHSIQYLANFDLKKVFLVCFLNPNMIIFWSTVGVGLMQQCVARGESLRMMIVTFFVVFLTINTCIVFFAHYIRSYLSSIYYQRLMQLLGCAIIVLGCMMIKNALL